MEHVVRFAKAGISRYLDFLVKMENMDKGVQELRQLTERKTENEKNYKGFNPFNSEESLIFETVLKAGFIAVGFTNKQLREALAQSKEPVIWNSSKTSRLLKRLRVFGLVKKVIKSYKYFLTEKARLLITMCVKIKNIVAIPTVDSLLKSMSIKTA